MPFLRLRYLWTLPPLLLIALGSLRLGPIPPLGSFLDPVTGVWSVAPQTRSPRGALPLPGLEDTVEVVVDRRGVPHLFAATDLDAWRALGWMHAKDRLFQLDLQTRATAGRLSEWIGAAALPLDREMRGLGIAAGADRTFEAMDPAGPSRQVLAAYADGIRAWVDGLGARDLPLEYHLLGVRPGRWEEVHTLYLYGRMNHTLSWNEAELDREWLAARVGDSAAAALLPTHAPIQVPVVPGRRTDRVRPVKLPAPGIPGRPGDERRVATSARSEDLHAGSNNWVVAPGRTGTGTALLAGDPHLSLTLPSVWYEADLHSREGLAIYGATIPGAPAVLIGLTPGVAWSLTNSSGDFVDRYDEQVDDTMRPTRHLVDGGWRPVSSRIETYRDRSGHLIAEDTFFATERGPMLRAGKGWRSFRWTALEVRDPLRSFVAMQRVRSVDEFVASQALLEAPSQNAVAADTGGHIAQVTGGRYPRRPGNDGGRIFDGTRSAEDWQGDLPRYPVTVDPARGFLFSANQQVVDPAEDGAYRGDDWPAPWRALRLAELLAADSAVSPATFRRWQLDPVSARAEWWLPVLIDAAATAPDLATPVALLRGWEDGYRPTSRAAPLFELTMEQLELLVWDEVEDGTGRGPLPSPTVLAALRDAPTDIWWDRPATPGRESRDDILRQAVANAWTGARGRLGPDTATWRWDRIRAARIAHIARLPGLGVRSLPVTGGVGTLSPLGSNTTHGASWRMVAQMGPRPVAWTTYPGGQSGNPASRWYDDRIPQWQAGELDSALLVQTPGEMAAADVAERFTLVPGRVRPPSWPAGALWYALIVLAAAGGAWAARRGRSPWAASALGPLVWGGALLVTWVPDASWRLAGRLGAVFGGLPGWSLLVLTLGWAALVTAFVARGTAALIPEVRAAEGRSERARS